MFPLFISYNQIIGSMQHGTRPWVQFGRVGRTWRKDRTKTKQVGGVSFIDLTWSLCREGAGNLWPGRVKSPNRTSNHSLLTKAQYLFDYLQFSDLKVKLANSFVIFYDFGDGWRGSKTAFWGLRLIVPYIKRLIVYFLTLSSIHTNGTLSMNHSRPKGFPLMKPPGNHLHQTWAST